MNDQKRAAALLADPANRQHDCFDCSFYFEQPQSAGLIRSFLAAFEQCPQVMTLMTAQYIPITAETPIAINDRWCGLVTAGGIQDVPVYLTASPGQATIDVYVYRSGLDRALQADTYTHWSVYAAEVEKLFVTLAKSVYAHLPFSYAQIGWETDALGNVKDLKAGPLLAQSSAWEALLVGTPTGLRYYPTTHITPTDPIREQIQTIDRDD